MTNNHERDWDDKPTTDDEIKPDCTYAVKSMKEITITIDCWGHL